MVYRNLTAAFVAIALVLAACSTPVDLQVTSYGPTDGATDVSVDAVVTATFNVAIDVDTVDGSFALTTSGGTVAGAVAYDAASRTATFTPTVPLAYETVYTATVSGSVATTGGVTLGGDATWSFTTEENPVVDAIGGIDVTPATADLVVGETVQLAADPTGVTGDPDLGVTWSSDDDAVATVSATGLVTAEGDGTATITATSDFDGSVSGSATITVAPWSIGGVAVTPATAGLLIGETAQLTATPTDVVGSPDLGVTWSSDDDAIATVSATGLVTAEGAGTAVVTATSDFDGSVSGSATISVSPVPAVASVTVTPATPTVLFGDTVQLTADVVAIGGADASVTWSSGDEAVATVDGTGLVTTVAGGTAVITATSVFDGAVSGSATVTVTPWSIGSVTVTPETADLLVGETEQLSVALGDVVGSPDTGVTWASDDEAVATVSATGLVTAVSEGTAVVTATSDFDGAVSGSATVTVAPVPAVDSVTVTPESDTLLVAETLQLTADVVAIGTAADTVTWSSDDEAVATVSATGLVTAVGEGTAVVTATSDFDGAVSDSATITVWTVLAGGAYDDAGLLVDTALTPLAADVSGGATPYAFATVDALPAGVSLDPATGTISGTPTELGLFTGVVTATDDIGQTVDLDFSIEVVDVLTVTPFLDATEGAGTTIAPLTVVPTGGLAPYTFEIVEPEPFPEPNGPLAPGLAFDEATGTISGTLDLAGFFSSVILTTDALGQTAETLVEIEVSLVLVYAGSPYDYVRGCGGTGAVALCPAVSVDEPAQGFFGAIVPESDIQVIGATGPIIFSWERVGGDQSVGWAISASRGVIFRSDQATIFSSPFNYGNTLNGRNGDRSYEVTAYDDGTGLEATFIVEFVEVPAP